MIQRVRTPPRAGLVIRLGLLALAVVLAHPGRSAADPALFEVPETDVPPRLEDFLGTEPNVRALRIDDFVQRHPGDGVPASERTIAYLSRDSRALYVVFVCHDREPDRIRANLTKREDVLGEDLVGVLLDTFQDRRRAYEFLANPRGIQRDAVMTEGQGQDASFDALWESRGQLTSYGYVVWMAIPFRSLRFPSGSDSPWGIGLTRRIPRKSEEVFWPQVTQRLPGIVPQLAAVSGFRDVTPGRSIQLIPYGAAAVADLLGPDTDRDRRVQEVRAGLDAKIVLRDRLSVDLTAYPDFSHVETDDPQVTINQRFEVYFPEKRPFFLENAGLFETPELLFFSRRIVNPRWGSRLSGKVGRWTVASLLAQDRLPGEVAGREPLAAVARVQREIGRESTLGALVTARHGPDRRNHVLAVDARLRLSPRWTFQGQAARTAVESGHAEEGDGLAAVAELSRSDRQLIFVNRYVARSPGLAADLGFIPRADVQQAWQLTGYRWRPGRGPLLAFGPGLTSSLTWDYTGRPLDRAVNPHFGLEFRRATQMLVGAHVNRETFADMPFDIRAIQLHVSSAWLKWLEVGGFAQAGSRINYAPAAGIAPFLGTTRDAHARVTIRPAPGVALGLSYIFTQLSAAPASAGAPRAGTIFSNHLARTKVNIQLTRELSLRAIVDYASVFPDPSLTAIPGGRRLRPDLLFTYQLNPWTALYVGYTQGAEDGTRSHRAAAPEHGWRPTDRQVFAKASYVLGF